MVRTKRSFIDIEDKEVFVLYQESNDSFRLISDGSEKYAKGTEVNGFYICAHCGVTIKINNKKQITLPMGTFYNLKENEVITHKKYTGFDKFTKVKN
jgi:hypothetical protein